MVSKEVTKASVLTISKNVTDTLLTEFQESDRDVSKASKNSGNNCYGLKKITETFLIVSKKTTEAFVLVSFKVKERSIMVSKRYM